MKVVIFVSCFFFLVASQEIGNYPDGLNGKLGNPQENGFTGKPQLDGFSGGQQGVFPGSQQSGQESGFPGNQQDSQQNGYPGYQQGGFPGNQQNGQEGQQGGQQDQLRFSAAPRFGDANKPIGN
ncbi:hypothetical protein FO519_008132 [Halicephalobus sp. NKZ332]|nr:hypothetical protein FO519_008132 [Halicephalobus sp. NKZ332]